MSPNNKQKLAALTALFAASAALGGATVTGTGSWSAMRGSTTLASGLTSETACLENLAPRTPGTDYSCRFQESVTVTSAPSPPPPSPPPGTPRTSYTTSFDRTEMPLSEGGAWLHTPNVWSPVRVQNGYAHGTQRELSRNGYDDSYAYLSGNWAPNQTIQGVVQRNPGDPRDASMEVLLMLRVSDDSNNVRGYECLFNYYGGADLVRWSGPYGGWKSLSFTRGGTALGRHLQTGDVLKCRIQGNTITSWVNDKLMAEAVDSQITSGAPGIGFFTRAGAGDQWLTLKSVTATSD